jgi:hypothetical protein
MNEDDRNVRLPTACVQGDQRSFSLISRDMPRQGDKEMPMSMLQGAKASAFDANGRLLVYAAPLVTGFIGAPLALSTGRPLRRPKSQQRKNWAKRRAYGI